MKTQFAPPPLISASSSRMSLFFLKPRFILLVVVLAVLVVRATPAVAADCEHSTLGTDLVRIQFGATYSCTTRQTSPPYGRNQYIVLSSQKGDAVRVDVTVSGGPISFFAVTVRDNARSGNGGSLAEKILRDAGGDSHRISLNFTTRDHSRYGFADRVYIDVSAGASRSDTNLERQITVKATLLSRNGGGDGDGGTSPGDGGGVVQAPGRVDTSPIDDVIIGGRYCVNMPYGTETIALRRIDPNNCGALGSDPACGMDLIDAVDVNGYIEQGIQWGFPDRGAVFQLPTHGPGGVAITSRSVAPVALPYYHTDGKCKTWIDRVPSPGKLLLARGGHPPSGGGGGSVRAPAPRLVCNLDARLRVGDRAERNGQSNLNLRNAAGLNGAKIGSIAPGTVVQVLEGPRSASGFKWYKIRTAGRAEGWVAESGNVGGKCGYYFVKTSKAVRDPGGSAPSRGIQVDGNCALHDAIDAANKDRRVGGCPAGNGADSIILRDHVALSRSLPDIDSKITINGNQRSISGDNSRSIFTVKKGATLNLSRVTLRHGYSKDSRGSAIVNHGTVVISGSNVLSNQAGKDGGAIFNKGSMTINSSTLSNNSSAESGGAIRNDGTLRVNHSTVRDNEAGEEGGAIRNKGTLTINGGTYSGNQGSSGGAISNANTASISDTTFRDNLATCVGGAIEHSGNAITVRRGSFSGNAPEACHGADCGSGNAKEVRSISYGMQISQTLGCSSAYHLYSFTGKKNDTVKIRMWRLAGELAPALSLWDDSGGDKPLAEDKNDSKNDEALIANYRLPARGTYTISANNFADGSGSYQLSLDDEVTFVLPGDQAKDIAKDKRAFYTNDQIDKALSNAQTAAIAACDAITSLGLSLGAEAAKQSVKATLKELVKEELTKGAKETLADYTAEQIRSGNLRTWDWLAPIFESIAEVIEAFPTGLCSKIELIDKVVDGYMVDFLIELKEGIESASEARCEIRTDDTVLAYNWPAKDGEFIGKLYAKDGLKPVGSVQLSGEEKFYMFTGKFGNKTPFVGDEITAVFGSAEDRGAAFAHEDYMSDKSACESALDVTELVKRMTKPGAGEHANPYVISAQHPDNPDEECRLTITSGHYLLFDTWGKAMDPPGGIHSTTKADNHAFRVLKATRFPGQGDRGSLYVTRMHKEPGGSRLALSSDPDETGWLATRSTPLEPIGYYWHGDDEKCVPGHDSIVWQTLSG